MIVEKRYEGGGPAVKGIYLNVRIGTFFDGTLNNRYNVGEHMRMAMTTNVIDELRVRSGSYRQECSNVARLFELYKTGKRDGCIVKSLYIEGVATAPRGYDYSPGGFDSLFSASCGMGANGINGCIERCCRNMADMLRIISGRYKRKKDVVFKKLYLDIFGFSRGAAAARRFCSCIEKECGVAEGCFIVSLRSCLSMEKFKVESIEPEFMGLFDTVSAYGTLPRQFLKNVNRLALRVEKPMKTVQFVAADEHREFFALTRINSARSGKLELIIPGAHSDVGGGYQNYMKQDFDACGIGGGQLVEDGWKRDENEITRVVGNEYSLLVLSYMVKLINEYRGGTASVVSPAVSSLPTAVQRFRHILYNIQNKPLYSFEKGCNGRDVIKEIKNNTCGIKAILSDLRHGYLHFSSKRMFGMHSAENGIRIIIDDNE